MTISQLHGFNVKENIKHFFLLLFFFNLWFFFFVRNFIRGFIFTSYTLVRSILVLSFAFGWLNKTFVCAQFSVLLARGTACIPTTMSLNVFRLTF